METLVFVPPGGRVAERRRSAPARPPSRKRDAALDRHAACSAHGGVTRFAVPTGGTAFLFLPLQTTQITGLSRPAP